ncbi:MAG: hypothetical protein U0414_39070 [Polyangiaceae bacterium]
MDKRHAELGTLVRYADDFVVMCNTTSRSRPRRRSARSSLGSAWGYTRKTRRVDLSRGLQGFDFLGCHLRKRMSGPIWERSRKRVFFLQQYPSQQEHEAGAATREGDRPQQPAASGHASHHRRAEPGVARLGKHFATGNASNKFVSVDRFVVDRLRTLLVMRKGRNLRPGEVLGWTRDFFEAHGLHRLRGTIRYPEAA